MYGNKRRLAEHSVTPFVANPRRGRPSSSRRLPTQSLDAGVPTSRRTRATFAGPDDSREPGRAAPQPELVGLHRFNIVCLTSFVLRQYRARRIQHLVTPAVQAGSRTQVGRLLVICDVSIPVPVGDRATILSNARSAQSRQRSWRPHHRSNPH